MDVKSHQPLKRREMTEAAELAAFRAFIASMGGEVLHPTNEFEIVRFRGNGITSITYRKQNGTWTHTGESEAAWTAFRKREPFRLAQRTTKLRYRLDAIDRAIEERDGPLCFYCDAEFGMERRRTREHLVATTAGGPNHISNLFHACLPCNQEAGHLSAPEKIRLRDRKRAQPKDQS